MTPSCTLCERRSIGAFYADGYLLIVAAGDLPTPGFDVAIRRSIVPLQVPGQLPDFSLERCAKAGIWPQHITPFLHGDIFRVVPRPDQVRVHHAEGYDEIRLEGFVPELSPVQATLPVDGVDAATTQDATGYSGQLSFEEAFRDALRNLPAPPGPTHPDQLEQVTVSETGALFGGIGGFHHLYVRIRRLQQGGSADIVREYVKNTYPDLAAKGQITSIASVAATALLPDVDIFYFSVGTKYPIEAGPLTRHTILIDRARGAVMLDLATDALDSDVAAALRNAEMLPHVTQDNAVEAAEVVALLAPFDPYFSNPTDGQFTAAPSPNGSIQVLWTGQRFRYECDFGPTGRIEDLKRQDDRIKPVCFEHRMQAQALINDQHAGLRVGRVIWDDLTAAFVPHHYIYEVDAGDTHRAGLAVVDKGPGRARFIAHTDRAGLLALGREILEPARTADGAAAAAQVTLTLLARAGMVDRAPMGAPFFAVVPSNAGFRAVSEELGVAVAFEGNGRLADVSQV